jgi:two-component system CheB/CheR fusion protein
MKKSDHPTTPDSLVVVGSSAGGVEALSVLVSTLPVDFPAPIVLAQHLDPSWPSSLGPILQRHTSLPVDVIVAHTPLCPGRIYVVPENCHVTIKDGFIEIGEERVGRSKPSIDRLLSSAAPVYGSRLIAVILTGFGSNGAAGAIEVKRAGGVVIIQNPETARYPSMPLALPPTVVDLRVNLERIGPLVYNLLTKRPVPSMPEQRDALDGILSSLQSVEQIDLPMDKTPVLLQRIGYRMLTTSTSTMSDYLTYLRSTPAERKELVEALLITHTEFFNDPLVYAYLKDELLPELLTRARDRGRVLRCWSAGCATGEEAYSLAMLLSDLLGKELPTWHIKIFATDLSGTAIAFARRGVYTENMLGGLPPDYKARFFESSTHGYRVVRMLRQMIVFGQQDLTHTPPFSAIDLVLCRNVLSWLTATTKAVALTYFAFSLFPGGYLLLGKAEALHPAHPYYQRVRRDSPVYRCIDKGSLAAQFPVGALHARSRLEDPLGNAPVPIVIDEQPASSPTFDFRQLRRYNELFFHSLPIGMVVIDRNYHIVTANGMARQLLWLHAEAAEQDFLHAVLGIPYAQVRNAIDSAYLSHSAITLREIELSAILGGSGRIVALSISPLQISASEPELAIISVVDITEQVQAQRHLEAVQAEQVQLLEELRNANRNMNEVNAALMRANEELEAATESMILTQEELQAKLEELETTNEELQASFEEMETTSEEMKTVGEGLEDRNKALVMANAALQTHTGEIQEQMALLAEIVEHAPFSLIVLRGPDLRVERMSLHANSQLNGQDVLGAPLAELAGLFQPTDVPIACLAEEVYRQDAWRSISGERIGVSEQGGQGRPTYTLVPSHAVDGTVSGVIIYAIGEVKTREQGEELSQLDASS